MPDPILVIGASGKLGQEVTSQLQQAGYTTRCGTRNPSRADLVDHETVHFDWDQPETFAAALAGVERVFLTARPLDIAAAAVVPVFVEECARMGVADVIFSSAFGADEQQAGPLGLIENHLRHTDLGWTILRPNFFMENFSLGWLRPGILNHGRIRLAAGTGRTSFVSVADVAAVAVKVFGDESTRRQAYDLTGDDPMSHTAVAAALTRASERPVNYEAIAEEAMRARGRRAGLPPGQLEYLLVLYGLVRDGKAERVSSAVGDLLGRKPIAFDTFAAAHAGAWRVARGATT